LRSSHPASIIRGLAPGAAAPYDGGAMRRSKQVFMSAAIASLALPVLARAQSGQPAELPEGEGRSLVQGACASCHALDLISRSAGHAEDEWRRLVGNMIALPEPAASEAAGYLAEHFPPTGERAPVLVPGDEVVT